MIAKQKILIVDDDENIAELISLYLTKEFYDTKIVYDGESALREFKIYEPNLVLLDLMLPGIDGTALCRRIREQSRVPIIMLTAKDDVSDKVMGLDMGADDYMTKPFAIEELLARIRVGLKKHRAGRSTALPVLTAGKLRVEPASYSVSYDGKPIALTKKEFDLLRYLMEHRDTAVTRDTLLCDVWGYDYAGDTNIVDVYIRYLRQKIDEPFQIKTIHTIRAVGYMFSYEEK